MNRAPLRAVLALVLLQAAAGCASLRETALGKDAPPLTGSPDSTGLVVVDSEVEVIGALFGARSRATPTGGMLARLDGDQGIVYGKTARGIVVFSGLSPGRWRLVAIDADWDAGGPRQSYVVHRTLRVGALEAQVFSFDVRVGEPLYVGRVKIHDDYRDRVYFERIADPQAELKAWQKLAAIYTEGPWASRLRARF